jgi:hypothetical protein
VAKLPDECKRVVDPTPYRLTISEKLQSLTDELVRQYSGGGA